LRSSHRQAMKDTWELYQLLKIWCFISTVIDWSRQWNFLLWLF
jgi:hypothetical protein